MISRDMEYEREYKELVAAVKALAAGGDARLRDDAPRDVVAALAALAGKVKASHDAVARIAAAEQAFASLKTALSETERTVGIGNWRWDIPTNKVQWSDGLFGLYGIKPSDFNGSYEAFLAFVHHDDVERVKAAIQEAWKSGKAFEFDHRIIRPDGRELTMHAKGSVAFDNAGNVVGMFGTGQDVTANRQLIADMRKYAAELERINKLMVGRELKMVELKRQMDEIMKGKI